MAPGADGSAVSTLKRELAEEHQRPAWRIDILQDGHWLPSNATVDATVGPLQIAFRQREKRSISIDAKLVNEISCDSLRESYIQNLREDLGLGRTFYQEIALTVTDWGDGMPGVITALLVEFLASRRDDPNIPCLVHLDLHGQLAEVLEAMMRNRDYYESIGSSLETLELSLADGQALVLPLFPNLIALRMYKPEFPARGMTDYSIRLLRLNCRSLQDVAIVGDDAKIFGHVLAILAGEAFDAGDRAGRCLWLVGPLAILSTALRSLGDLLEKLRSAERPNFLTRLGKLNIHVDDAGNEGFGTIRAIASAALNRGLDDQQIAQRPKVLTTIRSMRPALRPNDTLMCLFDVTALSLGVATCAGTQLVEDATELQRLRGALLMLRIQGTEELQVECSTLGGALVLSFQLPAQSTVAELEERLVTALGDSWKDASFWLGEHQVSQQSRLMNCDSLVAKEEKDAFMTCLLQRNSTVPSRSSKVFTVASPGQQGVWLQILEGELPFAKENHVVGQLRLDGLQPPVGMGSRALVEVQFDLDANDVLHVTASDLGSGASCKASFPFEKRCRVPPQDLERAVQRAEALWKLKSVIQDRSDLFDHCCRALKRRGDADRTELLKMMAAVDEADIADDVDYKAQLRALLATQNDTAIEDLD